MSTRQYIVVIKENAECHQRMMSNPKDYYRSNEEINDDWTQFFEFVNNFGKTDEFCIGKMEIPAEIGSPFFENPDTQEIFKHYNPRIIAKEDLKMIIDLYQKVILKSYQELLASGPDSWHVFMDDKVKEWSSSYSSPYILDGKKEMVRGYDDELRFWDLVRLYKQVDWNDPMTRILYYQW